VRTVQLADCLVGTPHSSATTYRINRKCAPPRCAEGSDRADHRAACMALDQSSVHMQHNNTTALQQIGVEVEFIPPAYTSVLQVLDKGVHKPFKQYLREESMAFMLRNPEGTKPTQTDIALWIINSWEQIQPTTILNTWESIGIRPIDHYH
jgi:hypothetical protein